MTQAITSKPGSQDAVRLERASVTAETISKSRAYQQFVEAVRASTPWRFQLPPAVLDRDYLRIVDHHLRHLLPRIRTYMSPDIRRVLDFGCGSGGSTIAMAMVYPDASYFGTDIDAVEIAAARQRAKVYGVDHRCEFHHVEKENRVCLPDGSFDLCLCSSVLEYAVEPAVRAFCVQEMVRLLDTQGLLFVSVPNRLYPFEVHSRKWGWNYFPKLLRASIVDSSCWEVRRLAKPAVLRLFQTRALELFRPWSTFCLRKEPGRLRAV